MRTIRLIQPAKQRFTTAFDYSKTFERHIRRTLSATERAIIYNLEKARLTGRPCRCHILDRGSFDSRPLLIRYLNYLDPSGLDSVIVANTRPEGQALLPRKSPVKVFSSYSKYAMRGHTYRFALALDTHDYAPQLRGAILPALTGTVLLGPRTLIIIHSRGFTPGLLPEAFAPPDPPPRFGVIRCSSPDGSVEIIIEFLTGPAMIHTTPELFHPQPDPPRRTLR